MIPGVSRQRRATVIGAGLLGCAAAWSLARRGWLVTLVEAAPVIGHTRSGSKGSARIFRVGYPDPLYVEMARTAQRLWRDLERASGRTLLRETGQVTLGDGDVLEAIAAAMAASGRPPEHLTSEEVARRAPGVLARGPVLFEPESGVLRADACLDAFCATGDVDVQVSRPVSSVEDRGQAGVTVHAGGEAFTPDVGVVCAGPRTLDLLGLGCHVSAPASFPQVAYFAPKEDDGEGRPPVFIEWGGDMIYGLPVPDGPRPAPRLYKVAHHTPGAVATAFDPLDPAPLPDDTALVELLCHAVERLLPGLHPVPVATERCLYDNAADDDFILDRAGSLVFGCGTSGHAFKFGPLLGEMLADLAEGTEPRFGARFALARAAPPHAPPPSGPPPPRERA